MWASQLASSNASIVAAHFCDPFALLLLSDGCGAMLAADSASGRLSVDESPAAAAALTHSSPSGRITAASLFADTCGWLMARLPALDDSCSGGHAAAYALLCRSGGICQLYALPGWQLVWASDLSLAAAPTLLTAAGDADLGAAQAPVTLDDEQDGGQGSGAEIVETLLVSFGPSAGGRQGAAALRGGAGPAAAAPILLALTAEHQLLAYRAFVAHGSSPATNGIRLRFRRLPLDLPPLLPPAGSSAASSTPRLPRLHPFEGLGEEHPHSGVFVSGQHPHWLVATRGTLLAHPHHLQRQAHGNTAAGAVGFTPFHNINCPHGFILAAGGCSCQMPAVWLRRPVMLSVPTPPLCPALLDEAPWCASLHCSSYSAGDLCPPSLPCRRRRSLCHSDIAAAAADAPRLVLAAPGVGDQCTLLPFPTHDPAAASSALPCVLVPYGFGAGALHTCFAAAVHAQVVWSPTPHSRRAACVCEGHPPQSGILR